MSTGIKREVFDLDEEFADLTGRYAFQYVSAPGSTTKIVFADTQTSSWYKALEHMTTLVGKARLAPETLPYPYNQALTPAQRLPQRPQRQERFLR